jgi:hypothetical protein
MGVLIVCPLNLEDAISEQITNQAAYSWRQQPHIALLTIKDTRRNDPSYVTGRILDRLASAPELTHVVVLELRTETEKLAKKVSVRLASGIRTFERRVLPETLRSLGLDWLSQLEDILRNGWHHGTIDRNYLEGWILQFDKCGDHGWVGKALLRILEFWSDARVREALKIHESGLSGFDCVTVNRHKRAGKSADAIAQLVQKQLDAGRYPEIHGYVLDFRDAIENPEFRSILFVEDCMITGNEMTRILNALLGRPDRDGNSKADPLTDRKLLRSKEITLRFALFTNGGLAATQAFLDKEGLSNIVIDVDGNSPLLTLTPLGVSGITSGSLYDEHDCIANISDNVIRMAFTPLEIWETIERASTAMSFCATIGRQLYKNYLSKRNKSMSEQMLDEASLGIRGLALALAFSHSVPKETLPLFWSGSKIIWNGKEFNWTPLFVGGE